MLNPIGISGNATVGKDSLYDVLEGIFSGYGITTEKFSLATELKIALNDFTKGNYGISCFTTDVKQKTLIRPIMVEHGRIKRYLSNGRYFVDILTPKILKSVESGNLPIICDVRYDEYPKDELFWLRREINGYLVHIERVLDDGQLIQPANNDELKNGSKLKSQSDFQVKWITTPDLEIRRDMVNIQLKNLISSYEKNKKKI